MPIATTASSARRPLLAAAFGALALTLSACATTAPEGQPVRAMTWDELGALPSPKGGERLTYGPAPQQFGELRLPTGSAPAAGWPVAVLVHGGCWRNGFDYEYLARLADALNRDGVATWAIEYRRLGDPGGGWPFTFLDVAAATDHLRTLASGKPLDLDRVAAAGHSAGGQLALWLAARPKLPNTSALYVTKPLTLHGVVGLAPITDLETYRVGPAESCNAAVEALLGGGPDTQPRRYAETSPRALLPIRVPTWLLTGRLDRIVPTDGVAAYADAARQAGDRVAIVVEDRAGHFELAAPDTVLGGRAVAAVKNALD